MNTITRSIPSPIGDLLLVGDGETLAGLYLPVRRPSENLRLHGALEDGDAFAGAALQLGEWFEGRRRSFQLYLELRGTDFQRRVWEVLRHIPFGETMSYAEVAEWAGRPGSARAVGHAVGRNPVSIIVPCHRVIGSDGSMTGYAGGLDAKHWLLQHERAVAGDGASAH